MIAKQTVNNIDDTYTLRVGGKSIIDTKGGYEHNLKVPGWLIKDINQYLCSESWQKRASQSLYKARDENYVFLTKLGNPYYTSVKEIEDHNLQLFSKKIKFSMHKGNAARQALTKLINLMHKNKEDIRRFTLHDLRATFGVDLLISAAKHVDDIDQIIPYIQQRMGHRNVMNTIHYIRYITFAKASKDLEKKFENILYKFEEKDN